MQLYTNLVTLFDGGGSICGFVITLPFVYELRTSIDKIKENGFKLTRRYPAKTITHANCTDVIALLANATAQAETRLHILEGAAAGNDLHFNAHKTEYMCFDQTGHISTLNGSAQKLVDKFTKFRSRVSSSGTDIDTQLAKAWTAFNSQSVIWKSDLNDKMKHSFFQAAVVWYCNMDAPYGR